LADKLAAFSDSIDAVAMDVTKSDDLKAADKICQSKDLCPAGGWLKVTEGKFLPKVAEISCDFIILPAGSPVALTQNTEIGRILEIEESLNEALLRTVNDLPVDAVLISDKGKDGPLTLARLMLIRRQASVVSKPVSISIDITETELQALWDLGIGGVFVESVTEQSADKLAELHKAIGKLTLTNRKKDKMNPILPHLQPETPAPRHEEDEEIDDD
jgi:hypothetical protein